MIEVPVIDRVTEAFPANALDWMPAWEDIPDEFKNGSTKAEKIAHQWFYFGLSENVEFYAVDGVDAERAYRAVSATLRSFAPKHEHKMAAAAYMIDSWFKEVKQWQRQ